MIELKPCPFCGMIPNYEDEALLLAQWAKESVYGDESIGNPLTDWVGKRRPELFGINVYVVNESRHLACS